MNAQLQQLKETLFGEGSNVQASNFKMYRGSNQDASVEEVAAELNVALSLLKSGQDVEFVANINC